MTVICSIFSVVSFLVGWLLLSEAVRTVARRRKTIKRMQTAIGTIVEVHQRIIGAAGNRKTTPSHFPEIQFTTPAGESVTFRSETGDTGETSKYSPGQAIEVLFDPEGIEVPLIRSWAGVWDTPLLMGIGGCVFLFFGAGLAWVVINILRGVLQPGV